MISFILLVSSLILTLSIKKIMERKSLYVEINERSSHNGFVTTGGGLAILITWLLGLIYLVILKQIDEKLFTALSFGFILSIISFIDDLYNLKIKIRLFIHVIIASLGLISLGGLQEINLGFFSIYNPIITNAFALLLIVWFINLYNFLDGINGYAGSEMIFLCLSGLILFGDKHFLILMCCVLGFLILNYGKAKIFMGDVGSTLLGYNVAIFTLYYTNQNTNNLWAWFILFGLFLFDATYTLIKRIIHKEDITKAHKKHAYQRLAQSGWSHLKITNVANIVNIILLVIVLIIKNIFIAFTLAIVLLYSIIKVINLKKEFK